MKIKFCPVCLSNNWSYYPHKLYSKCSKCGCLVQTHNIKPINDYYESQRLDFSNQVGSYKIYLKIIKNYIDTTNYFLIDVGAGDGTFLRVAKHNFKNVFGYDTSPKAISELRRKGLFIPLESIHEYKPKVVSALQVIEHILEPREFINNLKLATDDYLVLTSPAVDSPTAQKHHIKGDWKSLSPSYHLCLYSKKGITTLLEDCGFFVVYYDYTWSACHGAVDTLKKYILSVIKWPIKKIIGRYAPFPSLYWKNSFLVIAKKK